MNIETILRRRDAALANLDAANKGKRPTGDWLSTAQWVNTNRRMLDDCEAKLEAMGLGGGPFPIA